MLAAPCSLFSWPAHTCSHNKLVSTRFSPQAKCLMNPKGLFSSKQRPSKVHCCVLPFNLHLCKSLIYHGTQWPGQERNKEQSRQNCTVTATDRYCTHHCASKLWGYFCLFYFKKKKNLICFLTLWGKFLQRLIAGEAITRETTWHWTDPDLITGARFINSYYTLEITVAALS